MANLVTAFNDHFLEFVNDVISVFPDDADIVTAKNAFLAIRKANPKIIIRIWRQYVVDKYRAEIEGGRIDFFLHKDYSIDMPQDLDYAVKIIEAIDRLRTPIKNMGFDDQAKCMKYVQNLTKLSDLIVL